MDVTLKLNFLEHCFTLRHIQKGFFLFIEQPKEALTLQEIRRKSGFLQYTSLLKQKSNIVIESEFTGILGGFTQNPKLSTDFREVTKS